MGSLTRTLGLLALGATPIFGAFTACTDYASDTASGDASIDAIVEAAASDTGSSSSGDTGAPGDAGTDAAPEAGSDAATCAFFGGVYAITGVCSNANVGTGTNLCIRQKACQAEVRDEFGILYSGVAAADAYHVTAEIPFHNECTGQVGKDGAKNFNCEAAPENGGTCAASAVKIALPGVTDTCCDVHAQDCDQGERCTVIDTGAGLASICAKAHGTVPVNGACTLTGLPATDDCAKGLVCLTVDTGVYTCLPLCNDNGDCTGDDSCGRLTTYAGQCSARCDLFPGGSRPACPGSSTCRLSESVVAGGNPAADDVVVDTTCGPAGPQSEGGSCTSSADCVAGLSCPLASGTCRKPCDDNHPCAVGACVAARTAGAPGISATTGTCDPAPDGGAPSDGGLDAGDGAP